ncbi:MAG: GNAT family N-acetyltransferase [Alphaproteobacteria bacterium]|nr:GNAT family N-acetyltransferase [Alphaproteobacteria bacterium]
MTRREFDTAIAWAADEGWNPGLDDGEPFHSADPHGFIGTWLDGRLIACISAIRYGGDFGFIGFYLCHPGFRGNGYGLQTWHAGMAHLDGRSMGLDGVIDQQENYQKSGFQLAHRNVRFGGSVSCDTPDDARLRRIGPDLFDGLVTYDAPFFPASRNTFLRLWINPTPTRTGFALIDDGGLTGYGIIRQCRDGHKIGPLFADTEDGADLLFRALASTRNDGPLYIDPPEPNTAATTLAERYAMAPVFETARMYRGSSPDLPLARTFGITTFELG